MAKSRRKTNPTSTGTWCVIGLVGVIAILALIFAAISFHALRQMQNQQAPGEWNVKNDKLVTGENAVIINTGSEFQEGLMNGHSVSTEEGEVAGLYFSNQENLKTDAGIVVRNKDGRPSLSLGIYTNSSLGEKNFNKGKPQKPPACDTSPAITVDSEPGECPRSFVGINNKDPECHLHVNETMCVEGETLFKGNVTIDGILFVTNIIGTNNGICTDDPTIRCCADKSDCRDFNDCTIDNCIGGLCRNEQIPSCCKFDETCDDFNECTVDSCGQDDVCNFTLIGECSHSSDCPGNSVCRSNCSCEPECIQSECNSFPCEVRACVSGDCVLLHRDVGCCINDLDCFLDFDACTNHECVNNKCQPEKRILGFCAHDTDCSNFPNRICNASCRCIDIEPSLGECEDDVDCEDNCTCTLDFCCNGKCNNLNSPGCCKNDTDCNDANQCHENFFCNVDNGLCSHTSRDIDGDNVICDLDCNDLDSTIGLPTTWYRDFDGDGDGNLQSKRVSCFQPNEHVETGTDCDDTNPFIFSGSVMCNFTDFSNQFELASNPIDNDFGSAGYSVSVHNDKMIVGAPAISPPLRGAAIILKRHENNLWVEEAFLESGFNSPDLFGTEVKIYNDIAIVLCPLCGIFDTTFPIVIYEFNGTWEIVDVLSLPIGNDMKFQIDLFDEKILVAASNTTTGFAEIFIYDRNQTTTDWELTQAIDIDGEITDIAFDKSDSDYFTFGRNELGTRRVFVYFSNGGSYSEIFEIPGDSHELNFGASVDFHNGIVVVGSPSPNDTNFREKIFVYEVSGTNVSFVQFVRPRYVTGLVDSEFSNCGTSIAIYDDLIVVGCPNERVDDNIQGAVNIFKLLNSSYRWIARMIPPSLESTLPSLYSQSVDVDNGTIVSGAPGTDATTTSHFNDGNVYINRCNEIRTC